MCSIMRDPKSGEPLRAELHNGKLILTDSAGHPMYQVIDGIVRILAEGEVVGRNIRYQQLYDKIAWWYSTMQGIIYWYYRKFSRKSTSFENHVARIKIKGGENVLEVSIGTGLQVDTIHHDAHLYGLDISLGMLQQCRRRCAKRKEPVVLVHAMAEYLPFQDESFDVIVHIGGINFFDDKALALREMIRVAKPGARFIIADETEQVAKKGEKMWLAKQFFVNRDEEDAPPVDLIPQTVETSN